MKNLIRDALIWLAGFRLEEKSKTEVVIVKFPWWVRDKQEFVRRLNENTDRNVTAVER